MKRRRRRRPRRTEPALAETRERPIGLSREQPGIEPLGVGCGDCPQVGLAIPCERPEPDDAWQRSLPVRGLERVGHDRLAVGAECVGRLAGLDAVLHKSSPLPVVDVVMMLAPSSSAGAAAWSVAAARSATVAEG